MDLMEIRRQMMGVITGMASGANCIKGTFTVPNNASNYKLEFGKTFSKYIYYLEMTDESKTALKNSGLSAVRAFGFIGIYPKFSINNAEYTENSKYVRYNPSTNAVSGGDISASAYGDTYITFAVSAVTGTVTSLFQGYAYNYIVCEVE